MKKICFITTGDIKDIATSKRALGMANPLADLGYQVYILLQDSAENRKRVELECDSRIEIFFYEKLGTWGELRQKNSFLKKIRPDIIYICAFVLRNIPLFYRDEALILTEHSELQSGIADVKGVKRIMALLLEYFSIYKSDALLNASKYLEGVYQERTVKLKLNKPMFYFPYAFNKSIYVPVDFKDLPDKYKGFSNSFNFLFLGTITRNYGAFIMLDAFKEIAKKNRQVKFFMLGKGRHYDEVIEYIKVNNLQNQVILSGYVDEKEISYFFSIASVFLSPMNDSIQDWARCPSKLYMYLPFQKPIISCKIGETYETLKKSGYYYETGNSDDLAKCMLELILEKEARFLNDFNLHSWETRTKEFDTWLKEKIYK